MFAALSFLLFLCFLSPSLSAQESLEEQVRKIIRPVKATVGMAVSYDGRLVTVHDDRKYAMMSTFKFPLALAVLDRLEKQKLPLDTEIYVTRTDLHENTYSPLREARPEGGFNMSIGELLRYSVSQSDNNACDILIKYLGGITQLQDYLDVWGIMDMEIKVTEDQMHRDPECVYSNRTRPSAAVRLLDKFLCKELLREPYQAFLEKILIGTTTGTDKLRGFLPAETVVGHKTGSSDRNAKGMKIADNDLGFVLLPNGKYYTIAVFIMDSMEDDKTNAAIIARISKVVYDFYNR